jgi:hypothetical protein
MVQQSPIDEQIREYLLQQEGIDEARCQQAPIDQVRQERGKWERRLGYFILAGVAVVVFALNQYFHNKSGQLVLIVLGGGALAILGALIYVNSFIWVTEKLGYKVDPRSFKLTITSTGMKPASIAPSTATLRLPTPSLLMTTTPALNGKLRCALRSTRRWKGNGLL